MSGIKETYVQLTTTQRDTMLRQCREAQEAAARERAERERQVAEAQREANERVVTLSNQFNTQIAGLSNEMRVIERKQNEAFSNALTKQGADIRNEMRETERKQNEAFRSALAKQGADIRREMQQQQQELTQMIGNIEREINAKEQGQKQRAEFWVSQAEAYIKEIDNYRHDLFTPHKLQMLRTRIQQTLSNINAGDYQAAIATAQETFNGAVVLRSDVVIAQLEWERYYEELSMRVAELASAVNATKLLEWQIGEETVRARVDYWTNGRLGELERRFAEVQQIVRDPGNATSDELVSLVTEVYDMSGNLSSITTQAKEGLMLSAYRADMVNEIAAAMKQEGWEINEYGYKGGEEKDELHAKITDVNGNEMVVIVAPQQNDDGRALGNKLELNFFNDREYDMSNVENANRYVRHVLRENGIDVNLTCVGGFENKPSNRREIREVKQTVSQQAEG